MEESFGSWLMDALVEREMTPADLGRALKRPSSTISSWTRPVNSKVPNAFYVRMIAKVLDLPAEEVLERAGHVTVTIPLSRLMPPEPEPNRPASPAVSHHLETYESLSPEARAALDKYMAFLKAQDEAG